MLKDSIQEQSKRTLYDLMQTQLSELSDYFYGISVEITKIEDAIKSGKYTNDEIIDLLKDLIHVIY